MVDNSFFDEQTEQSLIKSQIVTKYFDTWASIMISNIKKHNPFNCKIAYIDLFSGPGKYKDGKDSTPVKILEKAMNNSKYSDNLICIFNDKDKHNIELLQNTLQNLDGIKKLKNKPRLYRVSRH